MYILKNALTCILRAKGRNILIGIIALVISVSACLGLSIRQASERAREETLAGMTVTANISYDRHSMMSGMSSEISPDSTGITANNGSSGKGGFDRKQFADIMENASSLSLDEYLNYSTAPSVQDFYYTLTAYFNGSDSFEPVSTDSGEADYSADENAGGTDASPGAMSGWGKGGMNGGMMGEFFGSTADYITEIDSAMNLTVVLQMIGIGLLLTLAAGTASVLFVMRYDPLKIPANRD